MNETKLKKQATNTNTNTKSKTNLVSKKKVEIVNMYGPPIIIENYRDFFVRKFKREFIFCNLIQ